MLLPRRRFLPPMSTAFSLCGWLFDIFLIDEARYQRMLPFSTETSDPALLTSLVILAVVRGATLLVFAGVSQLFLANSLTSQGRSHPLLSVCSPSLCASRALWHQKRLRLFLRVAVRRSSGGSWFLLFLYRPQLLRYRIWNECTAVEIRRQYRTVAMEQVLSRVGNEKNIST